jgi:ABC-type polysaccharide/polyol phosphate transport system ATPase subunit
VSTSSPGRIEFSRVWKKFRYGEHNQLRDAIPSLLRRVLRRADPEAGLWSGEFWALRDVDFTVTPGEALGIIGPNGAGKSTILKLLTRILRPSHGRCHVDGRLGSLIEVTAGFHPDLTGRENVFLQGVIMGMPRRDIARRFDEIVDFAGVSSFIDTPVKRYSSGMQARLGFAIAAHLEPDVLVVDEALSVGDEAFQRKAFRRVSELVRQHIPVVVVSHQLDAIQSLCTRAMLLDRGRMVRTGTPAECVAAYLHGLAESPESSEAPDATAVMRIEAVTLSAPSVPSGHAITVTLPCRVRTGAVAESQSIRLRIRGAASGETLAELDSVALGAATPSTGTFVLTLALQMNLPRGLYIVEAFAWQTLVGRVSATGPSTYVEVLDAAPFEGRVQLNPILHVAAVTPRAT